MAYKNGFFQLLHKPDGTYVKVYPPMAGGQPLSIEMLLAYLETKKIECDIKELNRELMKVQDTPLEIKVNSNEQLPENEYLSITISPDSMEAVGVFFPPSNKGKLITKAEILSDLAMAGIKHGIQERIIDAYLAGRQFCIKIPLARGTKPREGKSAVITYHFNTEVNSKPKVNEDGSLEEIAENSEEIAESIVIDKASESESGEMDGFGGEATANRFSKTEVVRTSDSNTTDGQAFAFDASTNSIMIQVDGTESVQGFTAYASVSELIEQFAEQAKVHIAQDATKMEMLLNPEHLGKLYLEITEQEGAITAKIQTQNAVVKEALEAQIADLRQSLNQAGVKVDAIEVTIASHEFERNLEKDANSQKQQEDAQRESSKMRNINMNELDGLKGIMSEEETIVAKMMAEQGNSVNFTA